MTIAEHDFSNQHVSSNWDRLAENPFPGHGIVMGVSESGESVFQIYWIMERCDTPQDQEFELDVTGEIVDVAPGDVTKYHDTRQFIYNAMRKVPPSHIVSNGRQTDKVAAALYTSKSPLEDALDVLGDYDEASERGIFTPQIAGVLLEEPELRYLTSTIGKDHNGALSKVFTVGSLTNDIPPGHGVCYHMYLEDDEPLPDFTTEPYEVYVNTDAATTAREYWELLNEDHKVSLAVKEIHRSGLVVYAIHHRNDEL